MAKKIDPFPGQLTLTMVSRPFITKTGRNGCQHIKTFVLTDEQRAWLCRWFPEVENSRLMEAWQISSISRASTLTQKENCSSSNIKRIPPSIGSLPRPICRTKEKAAERQHVEKAKSTR